MSARTVSPLLLALALSAGPAAAGTTCQLHADFDFHIARDGLVLKRDEGAPEHIRMSAGRLWFDGEEQSLSAADRERIAEIEAQTRALLPKIKDIALDSVSLAVEAVGRVAGLLDADAAAKTRSHADALRERLSERIDASFVGGEWDDAAMEAEIEALVEQLVPQIAGEFAATAVKAALSGDESAAEAVERRAEGFGKQIEREMKVRAERIEARAEQLCPQIESIDELEDALELRLADGSRLDLLRR